MPENGGILIKGMEMPRYGCDHCFLRTGNYCARIEKDECVVEYARMNARHPDCPLGYIPPHGSLIEKDEVFKLISTFPDVDKLLPVEFMKALYNIPTIIP